MRTPPIGSISTPSFGKRSPQPPAPPFAENGRKFRRRRRTASEGFLWPPTTPTKEQAEPGRMVVMQAISKHPSAGLMPSGSRQKRVVGSVTPSMRKKENVIMRRPSTRPSTAPFSTMNRWRGETPTRHRKQKKRADTRPRPWSPRSADDRQGADEIGLEVRARRAT